MKKNLVFLVGYVGQNLSTKNLQNGVKRVALRVATHNQHTNNTGKQIVSTTWHDVVAWKSTAEFAERNFVKGSKVMIEGSIEYRTYFDNRGHKRYITQIKAHCLMNLDR